MAGMTAAFRSPDTPEHLREHIAAKLEAEGVDYDWKILSEEDVPFLVISEEARPPEKGDRLKLPGSGFGTVAYVHPKQNIMRIKADDGKKLTVAIGSHLGRQIMAERLNRGDQ